MLLVSWWCSSAGSVPWEWVWRPYPGVWLFVIGLEAAYLLAVTRLGRRYTPAGEPSVTRGKAALFTLGVLCLWGAVDWPVGPLGAGYLVSVHTVQYMLIAMLAPLLLILGTPAWLARLVTRPRAIHDVVLFLRHPVAATIVFNGAFLLTHLPGVVDTSMRSQGGSFAVDLLWLFSGLVMWWPVFSPMPEMRYSPFLTLVYLVVQTFSPAAPIAFLTFSTYPLYGVYEWAPRVWGISAIDDQRIAGALMHIFGFLIIWLTIAVVFFNWFGQEEREATPALRWDEVEQELAQMGLTRRDVGQP
jgi:putative membrane protein